MTVYAFGPFALDTLNHTLTRGGAPVPLTPRVYDVLELLVSRAGSLVTKDELVHTVWKDAFVEDAAVTKAVSLLRRTLEAQDTRAGWIETVPKRGYRFSAAVQAVSGGSTATLAVLPVPVPAGDAELRAIADGFAADLLSMFGTVPRLRLAARSMSAVLLDSGAAGVLASGRELQAGVALTLALARYDAELVVDAELIDVERGWRLWGRRAVCRSGGLHEAGSEIVRGVVAVLGLAVPPGLALAAGPLTSSDLAREAYLLARSQMDGRTPERVRKAIALFEQASAADPAFALPHAGLAECYTLRAVAEYGPDPSGVSRAKAKAAVLAALERDAALPEVQLAWAQVLFRLDWDWAAAEAAFERALQLNSVDPAAHHQYAFYLTAMGRVDEALAAIKRAAALDPRSLVIQTGRGRVHHFARQHERAIECYRRILELEPGFVQAHFDLAMSYAALGRVDEAIAEAEQSISLCAPRPVMRAVLAHLYALGERRGEALQVLEDLERASGAGASEFNRALVFAGLDERQAACEALEQAHERREGLLVYLRVEPLFDGLRREPRFAALLRTIGLIRGL